MSLPVTRRQWAHRLRALPSCLFPAPNECSFLSDLNHSNLFYCFPHATILVKFGVAWVLGRRHGDSLGWQWKEVYSVPTILAWLQEDSLVGGETIKPMGYSSGLTSSSMVCQGRLAYSLGSSSLPHDSFLAQMVTQAPGGRVEKWACPVLPTLAQPWNAAGSRP